MQSAPSPWQASVQAEQQRPAGHQAWAPAACRFADRWAAAAAEAYEAAWTPHGPAQL